MLLLTILRSICLNVRTAVLRYRPNEMRSVRKTKVRSFYRPGGGVLARFYRPGGGGFELFCPGVGNLPIKKILPGGRGWSGLELTDTLMKVS